MEAVEKTTPDRIVLDVGNDHENLPLKTLLQLRMAGLPIDDIGRIYRVAFRRVALATERDLIFQPEYSAAGDWSSLTRWISAALGLVLGLLATPLMLVLWLGLKLTTSGPVLERQRCVGLRGQTFDLFRFHCPRDSQGELTPLARWVQRKRLQGLLQILNLLRGDIGLVGPKPEPAEEFQQSAQTIPFYAQRLLVKPGLTGWAQIQDTSPSDKIRQIEYDLYYIRHRTLALDLYTLLQSIII